MSLPDPEPGLVISYAYLWRHEQRRGLEEGRKTRPAVIVLRVDKAGRAPTVVVAPITHVAPTPDRSLTLPMRVKQHLGLDDEPSWIVLDEVNQFAWPGHDIRPVPDGSGRYAYGFLPPKLLDQAIARMLTLVAAGRVRTTRRT